MQLSVRPRDFAVFLFVMLVWGLNFAVSKIGLAQFPPLLMMGLRFILVAAVLLPFVPLPRGRWGSVLVVSVSLGFIHFALMFMGLDGLDASTAAIAIQLQVPFASLVAAFFFGDRLGWRRGLGLAIAFAGVAIIAGEPRLEGNYLSLLMVISAALIWALSSIQVKAMSDLSGWTINAWQSLFAIPQLLAASYLLERGQMQAIAEADAAGWLAVAYNALAVMVVGYGLWYHLLRRYDVNQAMPFTLLIPLVGVASGVIFLGERLTSVFLLGGALTVFGVAIILLRRPRLVPPEVGRV